VTSGWKQPLRLHGSGRYGKVFLSQTCALRKRLRVAIPPLQYCPIQLTDFLVVLIIAIRRHRAVQCGGHPTLIGLTVRPIRPASYYTARCAWSVTAWANRGPAFTMQSGRNRRMLALIFIAETTWFDGVCLRPPKKIQNRISKGQKTNSNPNILTEVWIFELCLTSLIGRQITCAKYRENLRKTVGVAIWN